MTHQPYFYPAMAIIVLSLPLCFNWIPRNQFYGVRTKETMASDESWYSVNQTAAVVMMLAALVYLLYAHSHPIDVNGDDWWKHLLAFAAPLAGAGLVVRTSIRKLREKA